MSTVTVYDTLFVFGFSQEEYEELLRYAIVTPNIESRASQPCHSKGEVVPDVRIPTVVDDTLHNQGCVYFERYFLICY